MSEDNQVKKEELLCPDCLHLKTYHAKDKDDSRNCIEVIDGKEETCGCVNRYPEGLENIKLEKGDVLQVDHDIKFDKNRIVSHEVNVTKTKKSDRDDITSRMLIAVLIAGAIIVVFIWTSYLTDTFMFEQQDVRAEQWSQTQCEEVLLSGKAIMERNGNPDDYSLMNQDDRWEIGVLEDDFLIHCTIFKEDVMKYDYDACLSNLVSWHEYVDALPSKDKGTWTEEMLRDTNVYDKKYNNMRCDLIETEMRSSDEWIQHAENHSDEDDV